MTQRPRDHERIPGRPDVTLDGAGRRHGWIGAPETPRFHVARARLSDLLDRGVHCPLLLVSAPAGSGKTSLLADWVSTRAGDRIAWVTFEESETGFWPGLVGCLERLGVPLSTTSLPVGSGSLDLGVRRRIASALAAEKAVITVVVDGYEVDSAAVAKDLDFLLRHSGHRLRLILLTRADPVLPLYRYRLEETVAEVRMADLAFNDDEAQELLRAMGVSLSRESVHVLNERTRGWITGLRFAGQMLSRRDDPDAAVSEVAGHSGNIAEYLMGEVLAVHPPELRQLLMATSIPDTIHPGLAEALAGRTAARSLAFLTRVNAFIEQVPEHPGLYRYHPFFRDLLRAELAYTEPETLEDLQRRTAQWFADQGMLIPAVHHYASAGAWPEAVNHVVDDLAVGQLLVEERSDALVQTLKGLPNDLDDPAARVVRASLALGDGDTDRFDELVAGLSTKPGDRPSTSEAVSLAVAVLIALRARFSNDPGEAEVLAVTAEQALRDPQTRRKSEAHPELAALVLASKGIATIRQGRLSEAQATFEAGVSAALEATSEPLLVECLGYLALIACCEGEVAHADALAVRALGAAEHAGIRAADRSAAAQVARAWAAVERYDLRLAAEEMRSAERSDFILGDPVPRSILTLVKSRLQVAQGDRAGALARVEAAAAGLTDRQRWLIARLHIEAAQLRVASGEPEAALVEVEDVGDAHADAEAALVVTQARLRLGDEASAAVTLADVLDRQAPLSVRVSGWLVESARQLRSGSTTGAQQALRKALKLAVSARLRRPFHEAPAAVRQLLLQDVQMTTEHAWLFDVGRMTPQTIPGQRRSGETNSTPTPPVEALTEKELEVLGHLAEMLTTAEIAAVMYISVNTVRTHVRNILRKLGVNRRNAAVRMAREFQLLAS